MIASNIYIYIVINKQVGEERKAYFASFEVFAAM
jgi:hypothetical protein